MILYVPQNLPRVLSTTPSTVPAFRSHRSCTGASTNPLGRTGERFHRQIRRLGKWCTAARNSSRQDAGRHRVAGATGARSGAETGSCEAALVPKVQSAEISRKAAESERLRSLMKAGRKCCTRRDRQGRGGASRDATDSADPGREGNRSHYPNASEGCILPARASRRR